MSLADGADEKRLTFKVTAFSRTTATVYLGGGRVLRLVSLLCVGKTGSNIHTLTPHRGMSNRTHTHARRTVCVRLIFPSSCDPVISGAFSFDHTKHSEVCWTRHLTRKGVENPHTTTHPARLRGSLSGRQKQNGTEITRVIFEPKGTKSRGAHKKKKTPCTITLFSQLIAHTHTYARENTPTTRQKGVCVYVEGDEEIITQHGGDNNTHRTNNGARHRRKITRKSPKVKPPLVCLLARVTATDNDSDDDDDDDGDELVSPLADGRGRMRASDVRFRLTGAT